MPSAKIDPQVTRLPLRDGEWPIRLLKSRTLRGRNVYHASTVVLQQVELAEMAGRHTCDAGPDFARQYLDRFIKLEKVGQHGHMTDDFVERLSSATGVLFDEALFQAILAVEMSMAFEMRRLDLPGYANIIRHDTQPCVEFVWETDSPAVSRAAARVGLVGFVELLPNGPHSSGSRSEDTFEAMLTALRQRVKQRQWSTTTAVLALAAKKRGLPYEHFGGHFLQLGHGSAQHLSFSSITGNTSFSASRLATNKRMANRRLRELGLPVPVQVRATTLEEAQAASEIVGSPIVVKPQKGNQASGVTVGIRDRNHLSSAFERAQRLGPKVIIESFVQGRTHRLLVVGGRFIAALQLTPPSLIGDGTRTIAELIDALNSDPLRNNIRLYKIEINDELSASLGLSGHALGDVLADGEQIQLHTATNVALGATHADVTDTVHPENQVLATRAAAAIGLDVAGVDVITTDISIPLRENGGCIIEVNSRPGLCMHTLPLYGKPRNVADAVLDLAFASGTAGRIPIALIAGDRGAMPVALALDGIVRASGKTVGLNTRKYSSVDGHNVEVASQRQHDAARLLLRDPRVETIVGATSPRRVARQGLGFDQCTVAAIMNPAANGDVEAFRRGIDILVKATTGILVVNAENILAIDAMESLEPRRIFLLVKRLSDDSAKRHLEAGGTVVIGTRQQGQEFIQLHREREVLADVPVSSIGTRKEMVNISPPRAHMFAIALAFGMGLSGSEIEAALSRGMAVRR